MRVLTLLAAAAADTVTYKTSGAGDSHCGCTMGSGPSAFGDFIVCAEKTQACDELFVVDQVGTHALNKADGDKAELRLKQDYVKGAFFSAVKFSTIDGTHPGNVTVSSGFWTWAELPNCINSDSEYACYFPTGQFEDEKDGDVIKIAAERQNLDVAKPVTFTKSYGRWPRQCKYRSDQLRIYHTSNSGETFCGCKVGDASEASTFAEFAECIADKKDCEGNFSVTHSFTYLPFQVDAAEPRKLRIPRMYAPNSHVLEVHLPATGPVQGASAVADGTVLCFDEFDYSEHNESMVKLRAHPCSNTDQKSDYLEVVINGGELTRGYFKVVSVVGKYDLNCPPV